VLGYYQSSANRGLQSNYDPQNHTNYHETKILKLDLVLFRAGSWIFSFGCRTAALRSKRATFLF